MNWLDFEGKRIEFRTYHPICKKRVDSFLRKEPDTIEWLKTLRSTDVFWDIGANMGIYALPAASRCREVWAFEPHPFNYIELLQNCRANPTLNVKAIHAAMGADMGLQELRVPDFSPGAAMTSISAIGYRGVIVPASVETVWVPTINASVVKHSGITLPTMVKIDVDGTDHEILSHLVGNQVMDGVREVLCELDSHRPNHMDMLPFMERYGFRHDESRTLRARRQGGPNDGVGNILFYRE